MIQTICTKCKGLLSFPAGAHIYIVEGLAVCSNCYDGMIKSSITAGTKHDSDKVRLELLSPIALTEVGKVMTFGAKKYDAHNWRKGISSSRLLGAMLRHVLAYLGGQDKDPETGLSHIAHAMCCGMFLLELAVTRPDLDDRYKPSSDSSSKSDNHG